MLQRAGCKHNVTRRGNKRLGYDKSRQVTMPQRCNERISAVPDPSSALRSESGVDRSHEMLPDVACKGTMPCKPSGCYELLTRGDREWGNCGEITNLKSTGEIVL